MRMPLLAVLLLATSPLCAQVAPAPHDGPRAPFAGPPTRVLVLGSVHLAQEEGGPVTARETGRLLERLAAFGPQVITVEAMRGETCDLMRRHPAVYDEEGIAHYCPDTDAARAATGLDVPAAIASVEEQLAAWPQSPTAAQRRRLAATFLAAGDPTSALVQWLYLPEAERRAGDGLDAALVQALRKLAASSNENTVIGAALAVRLGLQRVHPVDDHTGDNLRIDDKDAYAAAIRGAWDRAPPECAATYAYLRELRQAPDLLPLYQHINRAAYQTVPMRCDFALALADTSPQRYGRQYVTGWDLRNLRMVANIGETFRERPGVRVLSIVGVSHKPWFDRLLGQLQGVEVVDAAQVLGD